MSDFETHALKCEDPDGGVVILELRRKPNPDKPPVLLLHGASANWRSFATPGPDAHGTPRSLADWLHTRGHEPWLLNWRGNGEWSGDDLVVHRDVLDFDHTAREDLPAALEKIRTVSGWTGPISAVGHCMGAASLAQAIASGTVGPAQGLGHVVLLAIGLFYEPAWDGRIRSQDPVLERLIRHSHVMAVDSRVDVSEWPDEIREIYYNWPVSQRPHPEPRSEMDEICNRLSFMYGRPYSEANLPAEVHRGSFLREQFGSIPIRMYVQGALNTRRGWAAPYDADMDDTTLVGEAALDRFRQLDRITLVTGEQNRLWHRESIDRMAEWLRRGRIDPHKRVLPGYAHQDLLWGPRANREVFGLIRGGLWQPETVVTRAESPASSTTPATPRPTSGTSASTPRD